MHCGKSRRVMPVFTARSRPLRKGSTRSFHAVLIPGLLTLLAGCATGLGPKAVRGERPDYNQQILRSADAEMLLNLVRMRYNDTPLFLELGTVVASYGYDAWRPSRGALV